MDEISVTSFDANCLATLYLACAPNARSVGDAYSAARDAVDRHGA